MTAEILLVILLVAAAGLAVGLGTLVFATLGPAGWLVVLALFVTAALGWRFAVAKADWPGDDLQDDWRVG